MSGADPLRMALERTVSGGRPFPVTLISGVEGRPGALGPLFSYLAPKLRARRPWGMSDRLASSHGLVARMRESAESGDLEAALLYLQAILFPNQPNQAGETLFLGLWNLDASDRLGWTVFQSLGAVATLAARQQRRALYIVATADTARAQAMAAEFDLVVPVSDLDPHAYDAGAALALRAAAVRDEPPAERELRLQLPVARIRRRHDEVSIDLRAPEPGGAKGLGGALFGRFGQARQREEERLVTFAREAMVTVFRWDPLLQYVELSLLREERGARRTAVELKAERRQFPAADEPQAGDDGHHRRFDAA